jgi:hypothetical protein
MDMKQIEGKLFTNEELESVVLQEPNRFNKPHLMVGIATSKSLTAKEKKIYNVFLKELCSKPLGDFQNNQINISYSKIAKELDIKNRTELDKAIDEFRNIDVFFEEEFKTSKAKMISGITEPKEQSENIKFSSDSLEIRFDTKLANGILQYYDLYAKLNLAEMATIKNTYALTFYEIFKRHIGTWQKKYMLISQKEIRAKMNVNEKYLETKDFNKYVIKKAIDEINSKTKFNITTTKKKVDGEQFYSFKIMHLADMNFKTFVETIKSLDIQIIYKSNKYYISQENKKKVKLIHNDISTKPISSELAEKIWNVLFLEQQKDLLEFCSKRLGHNEIEFFLDEYEKCRKSKRRNNKK